MATKKTGSVERTFQKKSKKKRKGVVSKNKTSTNKNSSNYKKPYNSQGN